MRSSSDASTSPPGTGCSCSTDSSASSAERALSTSRRWANWLSSTSRSSTSPLRRTSSVDSAVAVVAAPWRMSATARRTPNSPKRSSRCSRSIDVRGMGVSACTNRSADRNSASASSRGALAMASSALYSASRSVAPDWASRPATGTTVWARRRTLGSCR